MRSRYRDVVRVAVLALAIACEREERRFQSAPVAAPSARVSDLVPGPPSPPSPSPDPYRGNTYGQNQGKTLFAWYNCTGCHSHGGGGMGPPLMDARWLYGSRPDQIFASISQGRPNGMPAFGGRVPDDQIWQLVAYVQSMSGHVPFDAAPGRADEMHVAEPESLRSPEPTSDRPRTAP